MLHVFVMQARSALLDRGGEVAAHDLHLGRLAACLVIDDGKPRHVHAHVGGGLVRALA